MLLQKRNFAARTQLTLGLVCAGLLIGGVTSTVFARPAAAAPDDSSYQLVWQDEFDGNALNDNNWGFQTGAWNSSGVQNCYKNSTKNVYVNSGTLKIKALHEPGSTCGGQTRDFTSGFIQTRNKQTWTYGYFEARIKMPNNASTWPAFWMSPNENTYGSWPRSGEIDIVETKGSDMTYAAADAHWGVSHERGQKRNQQGKTKVDTTANWHTYAVKWQEGKLEYYLDGKLYHTISDFKAPNATTHPGPFNKPFYLRLNLAVGGNYIDAPYSDANKSLAQFPATMEVDYVRVYQKSNSSNPDNTKPDNSDNNNSGNNGDTQPTTPDQTTPPKTDDQQSNNTTPPTNNSGSSSNNNIINKINDFFNRILRYFGL